MDGHFLSFAEQALHYFNREHEDVRAEKIPNTDLLARGVTTGKAAPTPFVRRYQTAGNIAYHCDLADAVGLLCLRTARTGGASRIVSSVSVYNELLRRRPDLVP